VNIFETIGDIETCFRQKLNFKRNLIWYQFLKVFEVENVEKTWKQLCLFKSNFECIFNQFLKKIFCTCQKEMRIVNYTIFRKRRRVSLNLLFIIFSSFNIQRKRFVTYNSKIINILNRRKVCDTLHIYKFISHYHSLLIFRRHSSPTLH